MLLLVIWYHWSLTKLWCQVGTFGTLLALSIEGEFSRIYNFNYYVVRRSVGLLVLFVTTESTDYSRVPSCECDV